MSSVVVADISVALKWEVREDDSDVALALLGQWAADDVQPVAPTWFGCEAANAIYQRTRSAGLQLGIARTALRMLLQRVALVDIEPQLAMRAFEIAVGLRQRAAYDAQYAALAEYLGCDLWTADQTFALAAKPMFPWVRLLGE